MHLKISKHSLLNQQAIAKTTELAYSWLKNISAQHPEFVFNKYAVEAVIRQVIFEKREQQQIFPGVFASPIGEIHSPDPRLVPLKLIQVEPGAIIPLHEHGGFEYYQMLMGSELIDTRGCYNEHCGCMCKTNEIHAVTNISSSNSFALIALPTRVELKFLNLEESQNILSSSYTQITPDNAYEAHTIFTQLLYADTLLNAGEADMANEILEKLDGSKIKNKIQLNYWETLNSRFLEANNNSLNRM